MEPHGPSTLPRESWLTGTAPSRTLGSQKVLGSNPIVWMVKLLFAPLPMSVTWGCQLLVRLGLLWCFKRKNIKMGSLIFLTRGKRCSDPSNQRAIIQSILDLMGHFFQKISEPWNSFMEKNIFKIIFGKEQLWVNSFTIKGNIITLPFNFTTCKMPTPLSDLKQLCTMEEDKPNLVLSNRHVGVRLRQPILILTKWYSHVWCQKITRNPTNMNKLQPIKKIAQNFNNFFLGFGRKRKHEAFP